MLAQSLCCVDGILIRLALYNAAWYASNKGSLSDTEALLVKAMKVYKSMLNQDHKDVLNTMAMVASTYRNQGRRKEAHTAIMGPGG